MRLAVRLLVLLGALTLPTASPAKGKPQPTVCPPDVAAAVAAACPCAGTWKNHGQYVSCVAHERNVLRKGGCLTGDARKRMTRCAARSTFGKGGPVVCCPLPPGP